MSRGFRMSPEEGDDRYEMAKDMAMERPRLRRPSRFEFDDDDTPVLGVEDEDAIDDRLTDANDAAEDQEWMDLLTEEDVL